MKDVVGSRSARSSRKTNGNGNGNGAAAKAKARTAPPVDDVLSVNVDGGGGARMDSTAAKASPSRTTTMMNALGSAVPITEWDRLSADSRYEVEHLLDVLKAVKTGDFQVRFEYQSVNQLIADLVSPTNEVARVITAVARGDLSQKMVLEIEG